MTDFSVLPSLNLKHIKGLQPNHLPPNTYVYCPADLLLCLKVHEALVSETNIPLTLAVDGFVHTHTAVCLIRDALKL